ncbi:helix-turn-helix domain-containing protein [Ralstonia flatus]|nr:helix-turn-helix domain-containing protein [Ralstonia sp. LMG 32965]
MEALTWARKQCVGNSRAKAVFMALADFASEDFCAFPSIAAVVEYTELDRKTIIKQIEFLIAAGFVVDTAERRGSTRQIPVYRLQSPERQKVTIGPAAAAEQFQSRNGSDIGTVPNDDDFSTNGTDLGTLKESQERNSSEGGTVPTLTGNSSNFDGKQSQVSQETVPSLGHGTPNNPIEPKGNPQRTGKRSAKAEKMAPGFDVFWEAYPRKQNKADAEKAWQKLAPTPELLAEILKAVGEQRAWPEWREAGGKYVPHAATWLNGQRWTDQAQPLGTETSEGEQSASGWWRSSSGVQGMADALGVVRKHAEEDWRFRVRVAKKAGEGLWRQEILADMLRTKNSAYPAVHEYFYGHPPEVMA